MILSFVLPVLGYSNSVGAASESPHQHGAGALNVVVDGSDLALEIRLPAIDVVGFEHSPKNGEQKAAVQKALRSFKEGRSWIEPSPQANCVVENLQASVVGLSTSADSTAPKSDASHDHKEKHDHGDKHSEKDKEAHGDKHQDEEEHADFEGTIQFHCDTPGKLTQLGVNLFTIFPGIEGLEVQLVTPTLQSKRRLSKKESVLKLSQ